MKVCVGNYGYYNEGELHDAWIELPVPADEIQPWLENNHLYDALHEEYYISDYDGVPFGLDRFFTESMTLETLNVIAYFIDQLSEENYDMLWEFFDCVDEPNTVEELISAIVGVDDIVAVYFNHEGAVYGHEVNEVLGRHFAEEEGITTYLEEHNIESYFDYAEYGRDQMDDYFIGKNYYFIDSYYDELTWTEILDKTPDEYWPVRDAKKVA